MKRFLTTFVLLAGVASSLVVSDSMFKQSKKGAIADSQETSINKSIDFTEVYLIPSDQNRLYVSTPFYFN